MLKLFQKRLLSTTNKEHVISFLIDADNKVEDETHGKLITDALKKSGIPANQHIGMVKAMGKQGVNDLLAASLVEHEEEKERSKKKEGKFIVQVPKDNNYTFTINARSGDSLYDLVQKESEIANYLECACGGNMTCSTCHVYIADEETFNKLGPVRDNEMDMIDLAFEPKEFSRLGCQVKLTDEIDEIKIKIPNEAINYFN